MNTLLWVVQALLALVFLAHGALFLFPPAALRGIAKQISFPLGFRRFIYVAEILAAFGLILPGLTGLLPWLTPLAASGLVPIMAGAVAFHISRRETAPAIVTTILFTLAALVACTRWLAIPL